MSTVCPRRCKAKSDLLQANEKRRLVTSPGYGSYPRKPQILGKDVLISDRLFRVSNMPRCSDCNCDLPDFETLCSKCFAARYSELGRPKSFLQSVREYVSSPLGLTAEDLLRQEEKATIPVAVACWCGGLLICWLGGWIKGDYKYSAFSNEVLSGALTCVLVSIGATLFFARTNLKLHWRVASTVFAVSAYGVAGWFFIGSGTHLHH